MSRIEYTLTLRMSPDYVRDTLDLVLAAAADLNLETADVDTPEGLAAFACAEAACYFDDDQMVRCALSLRRAVSLVNDLMESCNA